MPDCSFLLPLIQTVPSLMILLRLLALLGRSIYFSSAIYPPILFSIISLLSAVFCFIASPISCWVQAGLSYDFAPSCDLFISKDGTFRMSGLFCSDTSLPFFNAGLQDTGKETFFRLISVCIMLRGAGRFTSRCLASSCSDSSVTFTRLILVLCVAGFYG